MQFSSFSALEPGTPYHVFGSPLDEDRSISRDPLSSKTHTNAGSWLSMTNDLRHANKNKRNTCPHTPKVPWKNESWEWNVFSSMTISYFHPGYVRIDVFQNRFIMTREVIEIPWRIEIFLEKECFDAKKKRTSNGYFIIFREILHSRRGKSTP